MTVTWSSDHSAVYRNLQLHLAIANGLSLAIGSSRMDRKVSLCTNASIQLLWPNAQSGNIN
jgi:hypothetical protein